MVLLWFNVPATLIRLLALALILLGIGRPARADPDAAPAADATATANADATTTATEDPPPLPPSTSSASPASAPSPTLSASPAPSASSPAPIHAEPKNETAVRLRDRSVFTLRAPLGAQSPEARARASSQTLERLVEEADLPEVRFEEQGDRAVVFGGKTPIIQLGPDDAAAAGDASLSIHAASVAGKVREALRIEHQRKAIAETVFSISLFAFSGLIAILLLGKVREIARKMAAWMDNHPDRIPALRIRGIDLVRPAALRGGFSVALSLGRILSQLGIAYGWLLFASSLFESTRTYTDRLTGFVLTPLSALIGRIGSALPLLVITASAVLALVLLVRFVGLFFGSVGRGETTLGGLPADLAAPTGELVRFGIVIVALLVAAPLITGNDDGALARAGVAALVALGFASAPVLASVVAGIPAVYGRRVRIGDYAEIGGRIGRVLAVSLLEVRLEDDMGCQIRVPHLTSLLHPLRVVGPSPLVVLDVVADSAAPQSHVRSVLLSEARRFGANVKVELIRLDADGAHYRISARGLADHGDEDLQTAIASALERDKIALGRNPSRRP